jgi:hypothetical protein
MLTQTILVLQHKCSLSDIRFEIGYQVLLDQHHEPGFSVFGLVKGDIGVTIDMQRMERFQNTALLHEVTFTRKAILPTRRHREDKNQRISKIFFQM